MVQVRAITHPADFVATREDWDGLLDRARAGNVFLTFDWQHTWWRHYGAGRRLWILAAYEGGDLVGLAPLMLEERRVAGVPVFRRVAFIGTGVSDRLDILLAPGRERAILEAFVAHLRGLRWDVVDLHEILEDSVTAKLLPELAGHRERAEVVPQSICPVVKLARDPEAHLALLGKKLRHNLSYYGRRLRKEHAVAIDFLRGGPRLSEDLQAFFRLYREALADCPGARDLIGHPFSAFRHEVASRFTERDRLLLALLRIDGAVAAGGLYFLYRGTCYDYNVCFDRTWKRESIGTLLEWEVIQQAIAFGCHEYDCLRGDEPYKYQWGAEPRRHVRVRIIRETPKLRLLQATMRLARAAGRLAPARWPGGLLLGAGLRG